MHNESTCILNTPTSHNISSSQKSIASASRISRIRDKTTIYPVSTLNKIVFVSNTSGNGFQKDNAYLFDAPDRIDLEAMIDGIN